MFLSREEIRRDRRESTWRELLCEIGSNCASISFQSTKPHAWHAVQRATYPALQSGRHIWAGK